MNARKTSKRVASLWDYTHQKVPSDNSDPEETWGRDVFGEGQHGVAKVVGERPCYVYFMAFQAGHRFKVGFSVEPLARLSMLREGPRVDMDMSLVLEVGSAQRARQLESALHKLLDPYRIVHWTNDHLPVPNAAYAQDKKRAKPGSSGGLWDGATEWFNILCWPYAVEMLLAISTSLNSGGAAKITTLRGAPWFTHDPSRSPEESRRFNANRMRLLGMHMHLVELANNRGLRHELVTTAVPSSRAHSRRGALGRTAQSESVDPSHARAQPRFLFPKRLWLLGLANEWSAQGLALKRAMMDPHYWALESSKGLVHLNKSVAYVDNPRGGKALEIQFHWERAAELNREILRLGNGKDLLNTWQAVCQAMEKLGEPINSAVDQAADQREPLQDQRV